MYQEYNFLGTDRVTHIKRTNPDGTVSMIPIEPENKCYQEYLAWLAEGNQVLPAES